MWIKFYYGLEDDCQWCSYNTLVSGRDQQHTNFHGQGVEPLSFQHTLREDNFMTNNLAEQGVDLQQPILI